MRLIDLSVAEFIGKVDSSEPAPGGGSVSALSGALGVALANMVCKLTTGRKKYEEHEALIQEMIGKLAILQTKLVEGVDKDTEAFNDVSAVFTMPKETDEDKQRRKEAMQAALKGATIVPFEAMGIIGEVLQCMEQLVGKTNATADSDFGVAALALDTAVKGSWLNVLINLDGIADEAFVNEYKQKGQEILQKSEEIAKSIYERTVAQF